MDQWDPWLVWGLLDWQVPQPAKTNKCPLKINGWKTFSLLNFLTFCRTFVSFGGRIEKISNCATGIHLYTLEISWNRSYLKKFVKIEIMTWIVTATVAPECAYIFAFLSLKKKEPYTMTLRFFVASSEYVFDICILERWVNFSVSSPKQDCSHIRP